MTTASEQSKIDSPLLGNEIDDYQRPKTRVGKWQTLGVEIANSKTYILVATRLTSSTRCNKANSLAINVHADHVIASLSEEQAISAETARRIQKGQSRVKQRSLLL
jgi:hypothetical protein